MTYSHTQISQDLTCPLDASATGTSSTIGGREVPEVRLILGETKSGRVVVGPQSQKTFSHPPDGSAL